jgi:hypothetical protein
MRGDHEVLEDLRHGRRGRPEHRGVLGVTGPAAAGPPDDEVAAVGWTITPCEDRPSPGCGNSGQICCILCDIFGISCFRVPKIPGLPDSWKPDLPPHWRPGPLPPVEPGLLTPSACGPVHGDER